MAARAPRRSSFVTTMLRAEEVDRRVVVKPKVVLDNSKWGEVVNAVVGERINLLLLLVIKRSQIFTANDKAPVLVIMIVHLL